MEGRGGDDDDTVTQTPRRISPKQPIHMKTRNWAGGSFSGDDDDTVSRDAPNNISTPTPHTPHIYFNLLSHTCVLHGIYSAFVLSYHAWFSSFFPVEFATPAPVAILGPAPATSPAVTVKEPLQFLQLSQIGSRSPAFSAAVAVWEPRSWHCPARMEQV